MKIKMYTYWYSYWIWYWVILT